MLVRSRRVLLSLFVLALTVLVHRLKMVMRSRQRHDEAQGGDLL